MKVPDQKTIIGNLTPEQGVWFLARSDYSGLRQLIKHLATIASCTGLVLFEISIFALVLVRLFTFLIRIVLSIVGLKNWSNSPDTLPVK
ncbi:MAG: hypothetical protein GY761_04860 [Hyphomicrobiales bacterium]|nr:hypothetical protein [Hyphomicrobiales bacterium]